MGLTYHYALKAPSTTTAATLEAFLKIVENKAKALGFAPIAVINTPFDTDDQRRFARLLTTGLRIEHDSLRGITLLDAEQVWSYEPNEGLCRVIPKHGVVLVVTDQSGMETVFGFLAYPKALLDVNGRTLLLIPDQEQWRYRGHVKSPDPRFRRIVESFAEAGYLEAVKDEFA